MKVVYFFLVLLSYTLLPPLIHTSILVTPLNTPLRFHHATSPPIHPFIPFPLYLRLAAAALTSHSNRHRLFFRQLNNLYSHRKIYPKVPRMQLKLKPHQEERLAAATVQRPNSDASIRGESNVCREWRSHSVGGHPQGNNDSFHMLQ